MINHLRHQDIDKARWDLCISQSPNSLIYAYSWYLDIACRGWDGLVLNDYEAVFPLPHRLKVFHYLYQPFFTQQLGLFSKKPVTSELLNRFIDCLPPEFRYIEIQLNESAEPDGTKWKIRKRKNYLLDLHKPFAKLEKHFSPHARRNLKKTTKLGLTIEPVAPEVAVDFYIKHKGNRTYGVGPDDYRMLKDLLRAAAARNMLLCRGVYTREKELICTAAIYSTPSRLYIINNCVSEKGREMRSMYFLIENLMIQFAGQPVVLDFEGSDIPGVAQFNKGFGAERKDYYKLTINRLPWYLKWLKY